METLTSRNVSFLEYFTANLYFEHQTLTPRRLKKLTLKSLYISLHWRRQLQSAWIHCCYHWSQWQATRKVKHIVLSMQISLVLFLSTSLPLIRMFSMFQALKSSYTTWLNTLHCHLLLGPMLWCRYSTFHDLLVKQQFSIRVRVWFLKHGF